MCCCGRRMKARISAAWHDISVATSAHCKWRLGGLLALASVPSALNVSCVHWALPSPHHASHSRPAVIHTNHAASLRHNLASVKLTCEVLQKLLSNSLLGQSLVLSPKLKVVCPLTREVFKRGALCFSNCSWKLVIVTSFHNNCIIWLWYYL